MEQRLVVQCAVEYSSDLERTRDRINRNITDKENATLVHRLRNCLFSVIAHGDLELLLAMSTPPNNNNNRQERHP